MVIPSKEPLVSLGAEVVRLGLSVGKQEYEPKCVSVKSNLASLVINSGSRYDTSHSRQQWQHR